VARHQGGWFHGHGLSSVQDFTFRYYVQWIPQFPAAVRDHPPSRISDDIQAWYLNIPVLNAYVITNTENDKDFWEELITDFLLKLKLKLIYDRRSVGQSVLVSGSHLEPMTRFFFSV
jgi:hypothetical protein